MGDLLVLGIKPAGISTVVGGDDAAIASEFSGRYLVKKIRPRTFGQL